MNTFSRVIARPSAILCDDDDDDDLAAFVRTGASAAMKVPLPTRPECFWGVYVDTGPLADDEARVTHMLGQVHRTVVVVTAGWVDVCPALIRAPIFKTH